MFGIAYVVGAGLSAFAFVTFFLTTISRTEAMQGILKPNHFRDLGNLMLAFTMLWAYTNFSQFLLIWYGNIKEETPYYLKRMHGGWGVIAVVLVVFHFFLPFFMLLMRSIKDRPSTIAVVTVILLAMRFVNIYWDVTPAHHPEHFHFSWITIAAFIGIGGLWLAAFIWQLKGQTIIPIHETWVEEAIREGALTRNA
jgi:glucan phosphoethanolaminetransferase (alkaline phosphatase superfamily)